MGDAEAVAGDWDGAVGALEAERPLGPEEVLRQEGALGAEGPLGAGETLGAEEASAEGALGERAAARNWVAAGLPRGSVVVAGGGAAMEVGGFGEEERRI